jgi:hypothetical protein
MLLFPLILEFFYQLGLGLTLWLLLVVLRTGGVLFVMFGVKASLNSCDGNGLALFFLIKFLLIPDQWLFAFR